MKSLTIRSKGQLHFISEIPRGKGYKDAKEFLQDLVINYAHVASKFITNNTKLFDPAFAHREKQAHTILSPALFRFCDNFLGECPVYREHSRTTKGKSNDSYGYIDYVCQFKGKAYTMEVKQSTIQVKLAGRVQENWKFLDKQIRDIYSYKDFLKKESRGLYTIKLLISPIWRSSNEEKGVVFYNSQDLQDYVELLINNLNSRPNFVAVWDFGKNQKLVYRGDDCYYGYSGVAFSAKISKMRF
jgi:hypothetical protein